MHERLYRLDALLKRLALNLEYMASEFRQLIQKEHAMIRQRYLTRE